jgi:hypothetical protein
MQNEPNYALMSDIERRYERVSGLTSRDYYSIFYGPLRQSKLLMINANPGGTPQKYRIVDVMAGQHEYIEGRTSGPTTRNGAEMLMHMAGSDDPEDIRGVQVLNRFFRRSPQRPDSSTEAAFMEEARPFLAELINYIEPEAVIFGGDAGVSVFAKAHGGSAKGQPPLKGPNGSSEAVYLREYELRLPYYRSVPAFGIYHPSKMNGVFREMIFPILKSRVGALGSSRDSA